MPLSNDIISEFAKLVNNKPNDKPATTQTLTGTIVVSEGKKWVQLDGSDNLTPIESTDENGNIITQSVTEIEDKDRVTVEIKDHTATVTGNLTTPAASTKTTEKIGTKISEFEIIVADRVTADYISASTGCFEELKANIGKFEGLSSETIEAITASINTLEAKYANLENVTADTVEALEIDAETLRADIAKLQVLSTDQLNAVNASIDQLQVYNANFTYVNAEVIKASQANLIKLNTDKLEANWANIDYANIDMAKIGDFFAKAGILENITVDDINVSGDLVSVNITGSLIKGGTIAADKLMILGEDGLYHRLNATTEVIEKEEYVKTVTVLEYNPEGSPIDDLTTTGEAVYHYLVGTDDSEVKNDAYYCIVDEICYVVEKQLTEVEAEATDYNSLNGKVIAVNSITADKISVSDLIAFAATIGGFVIGTNSLHSGVKDSIDNTTNGIFMGDDGQFCIGDSDNYLKYYKDENGDYRFAMVAESILFGAGKNFTLNDDGITVEGTSDESNIAVKTRISNNGMVVYGNDKEMLTANDKGVTATDLHADTYLIVGGRSRFENYGDNRTGCFWIAN